MFKLMDEKIITILRRKKCSTGPMFDSLLVCVLMALPRGALGLLCDCNISWSDAIGFLHACLFVIAFVVS